MRAVKTEKKNDKSEIVEALKALAKEKGISEELLFNAIEEALKAAYKKNLTKGEVVPANLSVTMNHGNRTRLRPQAHRARGGGARQPD